MPARPAKKLAVVACMDARVQVGRLLGLALGDAHIIRNAGGVITDDVIRSLLISQRLLGTDEVMIIQHTECGMLGLNERELSAQLEQETGVKPHFAMESFMNLEENLRESIHRVKASPFVARKDSVRGFLYDVTTGRLTEVT